MLFILPVTAWALGLALWLLGSGRPVRRAALGAVAGAGLLAVIGLAVWSSVAPAATLLWGGELALTLRVTPAVRVAMVLVPLIALPVVAWAAAHEAESGMPRLLGLLLCFVGSMELTILAADLLTVIVGWELMGLISWALIGHSWRDRDALSSAAYAFNTTRFGGMGLIIAAGAAYAATGSFSFSELTQLEDSPWRHLFAAGILLAAAAKSAQIPFAPWLYRAMDGPSSVSALLHSSTMVAAGAWLLIRLHEPLAMAGWFGQAAISLGLATAVAGGIAASTQRHAKRLLAASTAAHYGLMFAAVGAGFAGSALAHLITHAAFKSLLFLAAGVAISSAQTSWLPEMRLGRRLPVVAGASAVGSLALAAVPPLGGAWSKEQVVAATGMVSPALAVLTIAAGTFSAWYAARFQFLAFGLTKASRKLEHTPTGTEKVSLWLLAAASLGLGVLWLPSVHSLVERIAPLASAKTWEHLASWAAIAITIAAAWRVHRHKLRAPTAWQQAAGDWLGLPAFIRAVVITPTLATATACARLDDRVVDAGVRAAARAGRGLSRLLSDRFEVNLAAAVQRLALVTLQLADRSRISDGKGIDAGVNQIGHGTGAGAKQTRRIQTGALPLYYSLLTGGLLIMALVLALWR